MIVGSNPAARPDEQNPKRFTIAVAHFQIRRLATRTNSRLCTFPRTADYIARRRADGKGDGEIRRMLKRYVARELYRALNATAA